MRSNSDQRDISEDIQVLKRTIPIVDQLFNNVLSQLEEVYDEEQDLQAIWGSKVMWKQQIENERDAKDLALKQLKNILEEVEQTRDTDQERARQWSFDMLSAIGICQSIASSMGNRVKGAIGKAARAVANWVTKHLQPIINSISSYLWSVISKLLTLTKWSATGSIGAGLFGFGAGSVSITLEFG